jgi:hypothetical protein
MDFLNPSSYLVPAQVERDGARHPLSGNARLMNPSFKGSKIRLVNLSARGFSAEGAGSVKRGDLVWITLPGLGMVRSQVRWRRADQFGAAFLDTGDLRLRFINGLSGA